MQATIKNILFIGLLMFSTLAFGSDKISINLFKNSSPATMKFIEVKKNNNIKIDGLGKNVKVNKTQQSAVTLTDGSSGKFKLEYEVSKFFMTKRIVIDYKLTKASGDEYQLSAKYKLGKDSKKWSKLKIIKVSSDSTNKDVLVVKRF